MKNKYSKYTRYHRCEMPECTAHFSDKECDVLSNKLTKFLGNIPNGVLEKALSDLASDCSYENTFHQITMDKLKKILDKS